MENQETFEVHNYVFEIIKAVIIAVIISLIGILIAALAIKYFSISTDYITIINSVIKIVSIFLACVISLRLPKDGWVRGIIVGIIFIIVAFFLYSALSGIFEIGISLLYDVAIGSVTGLISGIFVSVMRK